MIPWIQHIDVHVLTWIQTQIRTSTLDSLIPLFRNPYFWSPVYLFLLVWMFRQHGAKGLYWCLGFLLVFALCDSTSASLIKPLVKRIRPCRDPLTMHLIANPLVTCGRGFSFPSSHASNHTGMAIFMISTLSSRYHWVTPFAILWASLVMFAQMYVGVHYLSDILGGILLGTLWGLTIGYLFNYQFAFKPRNTDPIQSNPSQ